MDDKNRMGSPHITSQRGNMMVSESKQRTDIQQRNDRLRDTWIDLMHDLVAVENGISATATKPIETAKRDISAYLKRLPGDPKDWNLRIVGTAITSRLNDVYRSAVASMSDEFSALPRKWIVVQARALLEQMPDETIVDLKNHIDQVARRRKFKRVIKGRLGESVIEILEMTRKRKTTVGIDIAGEADGIMQELFRILGDEEMEAYIQTAAAQSYIDSFKRSFSARSEQFRRLFRDVDDASSDDLIGGVDAVFRGISDDVDRIVVTQTQAMSFDSFETLMDYVSPAVRWVQYSSVIDARTCLRCGRLNGSIYRVSDKRLPRLPLHDRCRCAYMAILGSDADAPELTDYDSWLRRQTDGKQREILGKTRYDLFRSGVSIDRFVNNRNRIIPVKNLLRNIRR